MVGLAMIYHKHLTRPNDVPEATKKAVKWIKAGDTNIWRLSS